MKGTQLARAMVCVVVSVVFVAGAAVAADRTTPPPLSKVTPFTLPTPVSTTLKNGLVVHVIERRRAPLVDVVINIGAGALDDADGSEGTATALADLLTQGAGDKDAFAFDDAVMALGARVDASAGWQHTTVGAQALASRYEDLIAIVGDVVLRPRLDAADWKRKQNERLGELAYYKDEPRTLSSLAAARALFPTGRQGIAVIGTPRSVTGISRDAIAAHHQRFFRPDNAFVVIVGDVDAKRAIKGIEAVFGAWPQPTEALVRTAPSEPQHLTQTSVLLVDRPGAPQSVVQVVAPIPADVQSFDPAAGVMQTLLGGSFTSRLNSNLREKNQFSYGAGYAYDVVPAHRSRVSTSVKTAVTIPAIREILLELGRIREPATALEVERARAYEALTFPAVADGGSGLAQAWASWLALGIKPAQVNAYMSAVLAVDADAVQRAAQKLVDPERVVIVIVGDGAIENDAKNFGPVQRLTAEALLPAP
jgi:predicted Zn-dependent peptidase